MSTTDDAETGEGRRDTPGSQVPRAAGAALVKRRWSIFGGAGSGVVILATAGAIALGSPGDQTTTPADPAGDAQELTLDQDAGGGADVPAEFDG